MKPLFTCIYGLEELPLLTQKLYRYIVENNRKIVYLYGDMGAGKTTFVKSLIEGVSSDTLVTSPTYSYVHEYFLSDRYIWHFDLYRITDQDEIVDLGLADYFSRQDGIAFIEWPEKVQNLIDPEYKKLILQFHHIESPSQRALVLYEEV